MKPRVFHPAADDEYARGVEYYSHINPQLGGRFYDVIERLIFDIQRQPQRFCLFDAPIRRHFSTVFPYAVLYVDYPDRVVIVAIMHMSRRPGYWHNRI